MKSLTLKRRVGNSLTALKMSMAWTHLNVYHPVPSLSLFYPTSQQQPQTEASYSECLTFSSFPILNRCFLVVPPLYPSGLLISFPIIYCHSEKPNSLLPVSTTSIWQILLTLSWFCAIQILAPVVFLPVSTSCSMHNSHNTPKAFILPNVSQLTWKKKTHKTKLHYFK